MSKVKPPNASIEPAAAVRPKTTLLQKWLDTNGFTSAQLETKVLMSRSTMTQIRAGRDVRLSTMKRILRGCRALAEREVRMDEIFNLDPEVAGY